MLIKYLAIFLLNAKQFHEIINKSSLGILVS